MKKIINKLSLFATIVAPISIASCIATTSCGNKQYIENIKDEDKFAVAIDGKSSLKIGFINQINNDENILISLEKIGGTRGVYTTSNVTIAEDKKSCLVSFEMTTGMDTDILDFEFCDFNMTIISINTSTHATNWSQKVSNIELLYVADWTKNWTIHFDVPGDIILNDITVRNGQIIDEPIICQPGYRFDGWFTDPEHLCKFDFKRRIMSNLKLYSGWTVNKYRIKLNYNGAPIEDKAIYEIEHGQAFDGLPTPTWEGYTFLGWFTSSKTIVGKDDVQITNKTPITNNYTLYARWQAE